MIYEYFIPHWFFGYDIFLELTFAIITLAVSYYAWKIYSISGQCEGKLLSAAFSFISASYILIAAANMFLVSCLNEDCLLRLNEINLIQFLGAYMYFLFFILGLATIAYTSFNINDKRAYALFILMPFLAIVFAQQKMIAFHIISTILLLFIVLHYAYEYFPEQHKRTRLVFMAFSSLFLAHFSLIFLGYYYQTYVIGHILTMVAYIFILTSLISIRKNEQKKV